MTGEVLTGLASLITAITGAIVAVAGLRAGHRNARRDTRRR